jgi:hypothetical protein
MGLYGVQKKGSRSSKETVLEIPQSTQLSAWFDDFTRIQKARHDR